MSVISFAVLDYAFRSVICLEMIFVGSVIYGSKLIKKNFFLANGYPVVPAVFVEIIFCLLCFCKKSVVLI